jgi:uncharacterized protein YggE
MFKAIVFIAALGALPFSATASDLPAYPFVHAGGSGATYFLPDVGAIDFEIIANDSDPAAARALVESRIAQIRALAGSLGIPAGDVEIRDVRKDIKKGSDAQMGTAVYELRSSAHIKAADLSRWAELVGPLLDMPNLDGFTASFDTTEREKVEAELLAKAMSAARRKALAMAKGVGMQLGAVTAVTNGDLKNLTRAMGLAPSETRYSGSATRTVTDRKGLLSIDMIKLAQPVDMIFRLK